MTGLGLSLQISRASARHWWPPGATWAADFRAERYMSASKPIIAPAAFSLQRATPRYGETPEGTFALFNPDEPVQTQAGLSLEPASTNLLTFSAEVTNPAWVRSGIATSTSHPDPTGGSMAVQLEEQASGALLRRNANITVTPGTTVTMSRLIRRVNFDWCRLIVGDGTSLANAAWAWVNLATGAIGGTATNGSGYGYQGHGCRRLLSGYCLAWMTVTAPTASLNIGLASAAADLSSARADIGNGPGQGGHYLIWNSQVETGEISTSPIVSSDSPGWRAEDELTLFCPSGETLTLSGPEGNQIVPIATAPYLVAPTVPRLLHSAHSRP